MHGQGLNKPEYYSFITAEAYHCLKEWMAFTLLMVSKSPVKVGLGTKIEKYWKGETG